MEIMQMGVNEPIDIRVSSLEYEVILDALTWNRVDAPYPIVVSGMLRTMSTFDLLAD